MEASVGIRARLVPGPKGLKRLAKRGRAVFTQRLVTDQRIVRTFVPGFGPVRQGREEGIRDKSVERLGQFVEQKFHIHLVSDATGETLNAIANAALAQFEGVDVQVHSYALVRSEHQLQRSRSIISPSAPGLVFFTLVNPRLARDAVDPLRLVEHRLRRCAGRAGHGAFANSSAPPKPTGPGRQHEVDQRYLDRIEALNFTIQHDDGQSLDTIDEAEVILAGASRTSKTPTCVYLAIRGVRAANVPLVPGMALPTVLTRRPRGR